MRLLKNVMGLWILESCRREWEARAATCEYDALLPAAAALERLRRASSFPTMPRFFNPASMLGALRRAARETGQAAPDDPVAPGHA